MDTNNKVVTYHMFWVCLFKLDQITPGYNLEILVLFRPFSWKFDGLVRFQKLLAYIKKNLLQIGGQLKLDSSTGVAFIILRHIVLFTDVSIV